MRPLARRTGRGPNWRDESPLRERADAVAVTIKEHAGGKEDAAMRANRKTVLAKEEDYLNTRPALPPPPASPPIDTPEGMRVGAVRALFFERLTGEFAIGTCVARFRETPLNATYRKAKGGQRICLRRQKEKHGVSTVSNNAIPTWRGSEE